jgi:hypothetical protein
LMRLASAVGPCVQAGLDLFTAGRFGLFVHWGPVSQWGAEISFPLACPSLPCTTQGPNGTSVTITSPQELAGHRQAYADLARTFNPTAFNASALADLAQAAGFAYLTWVCTHCDGFSNWGSKANANYSILTTPYGKDTYGQMKAAFKARGMRSGVYVCPSFWNRDDYFAPAALTSVGTCCQVGGCMCGRALGACSGGWAALGFPWQLLVVLCDAWLPGPAARVGTRLHGRLVAWV